MKKLKIEAGKFYRTRDGRKAGIYRTDVNNRRHSIHGYIVNPDGGEYSSCWYGDGRFFNTWQHSDDLIEEWQSPLYFVWDCLPPWCNKYVAKDISGDWHAYSSKPKLGHCCFHYDFDATEIEIPRDYQPKNFTGDWTDSVFKNPNLD